MRGLKWEKMMRSAGCERGSGVHHPGTAAGDHVVIFYSQLMLHLRTAPSALRAHAEQFIEQSPHWVFCLFCFCERVFVLPIMAQSNDFFSSLDSNSLVVPFVLSLPVVV